MTIEDSGKRYENELGGVRDTDEGKTNYRLIPIESLKRLANHYTEGLKKYGRDNWKLLSTEEDIERFKDSTNRHLMDYFEGKTNEDHLAACVFNIFALMYFESLEKKKKAKEYFVEQNKEDAESRLFESIKTITDEYKEQRLEPVIPGLNVNYVVTKKTQFEKEIEGD
jgi:hypothetical protein